MMVHLTRSDVRAEIDAAFIEADFVTRDDVREEIAAAFAIQDAKLEAFKDEIIDVIRGVIHEFSSRFERHDETLDYHGKRISRLERSAQQSV